MAGRIESPGLVESGGGSVGNFRSFFVFIAPPDREFLYWLFRTVSGTMR
jgi:hypothetical protein